MNIFEASGKENLSTRKQSYTLTEYILVAFDESFEMFDFEQNTMEVWWEISNILE